MHPPPDPDRADVPTVKIEKDADGAAGATPPAAAPEAPPTVPTPAVPSGARATAAAPGSLSSDTPLRPLEPAPGSRPPRRFARKRRHPAVRILQALALAILIFVGLIGYSVGGALTRPGNDSFQARVAEWGREHHLGNVVTWLEKKQYDLDKPTTGGEASIPPITGASINPDGVQPAVPHSKFPEKPTLLAGQGLPGEGVWKPVVLNKGYPAVALTYVRPDAVYTSYYAAMMWMDPKLLSGRLHEGIPEGDPGGQWSTPAYITPELAKTVATAFPGGFRTDRSNVSSNGGYYDDGREATKPYPLRNGAASLVIMKDGTATVGQWGRDVSLTADVKSVRQNLDLLVDNGVVATSCNTDSSPIWGYTVGNNAFVPRTAIGVRADGSLIFVNSPAVSVCSLGQLLKSAGVVRGMELDINYDWSIGYYYTHENGVVTSHQSRPTQSKGADHYFSPQSRDFVAFYLRP